MFALIGGWPGAAVAQQVLRHKSQRKNLEVYFGLRLLLIQLLFSGCCHPEVETYYQ